MASTTYRQELPPPKGYEKINYQRVPVKPAWPLSVKIGIVVAIQVYGIYRFKIAKQICEDETIEEKAGRACLIPMMLAERDRNRLKDFKRLHEYEKELMKDVPGWIPGTLWGEPVFKTVGPNEYYTPIEEEVYAHSSWFDKHRARNVGRFQ